MKNTETKQYKGYWLINIGYYPPYKRVVWEAINIETNCAYYHAYTKKDLIHYININKLNHYEKRKRKNTGARTTL